MTYMVERNDICMSEPMQFSQHWEIRLPFSVQEIKDYGKSLQRSYQMLRAGDTIRVTGFSDKHFTRLIDVVHLAVVAVTPREVVVTFESEIVKVSPEMTEAIIAEQTKVEVVSFGNAHEVRDNKGTTIEVFVDREQADAYAEQTQARIDAPEAKPAKPKGKVEYALKRAFQGRWRVVTNKGEVVKELPNRTAAQEYLDELVAA